MNDNEYSKGLEYTDMHAMAIKLSNEMTRVICTSAGAGFHKGNPVRITDIQYTAGPRVCQAWINCGYEVDRLEKMLAGGAVAHMIPWECNLEPRVMRKGRFLVVETQYPDGIEDSDITVNDVMGGRLNGGRLILGRSQAGRDVCLSSSTLEHMLVAGQTGSGKTETMRSIAIQLAHPRTDGEARNMLALFDGKGGGGLGIVNGLPGQVAPLAYTIEQAINGFGWVVDEMNRRYEMKRSSGGKALGKDVPGLFVLCDDFGPWTNKNAVPEIVTLMNLIATLGREAKIHLVAATQKPTVKLFGDSTTADQFSTIIGQRVKTYKASEVIVGGPYPRCDWLLPKGDAQVVAVEMSQLSMRTQIAYVPESQIARYTGQRTRHSEYPAFDVASITGYEKRANSQKKVTSPIEWALGFKAVVLKLSREWYRKQDFDGAVTPGAARARAILNESEEIVKLLRREGIAITGR